MGKADATCTYHHTVLAPSVTSRLMIKPMDGLTLSPKNAISHTMLKHGKIRHDFSAKKSSNYCEKASCRKVKAACESLKSQFAMTRKINDSKTATIVAFHFSTKRRNVATFQENKSVF